MSSQPPIESHMERSALLFGTLKSFRFLLRLRLNLLRWRNPPMQSCEILMPKCAAIDSIPHASRSFGTAIYHYQKTQ